MKGFRMPLKARACRKKGMMLLIHGIARCSVRPWRVWNYTRAYLVQESDQRGTCLVEILAKGGLCL